MFKFCSLLYKMWPNIFYVTFQRRSYCNCLSRITKSFDLCGFLLKNKSVTGIFKDKSPRCEGIIYPALLWTLFESNMVIFWMYNCLITCVGLRDKLRNILMLGPKSTPEIFHMILLLYSTDNYIHEYCYIGDRRKTRLK